MLVLSRKPEQSIMIGDGVVITIIRCSRGRVRLGIEAPSKVKILRSEVKDVPKKKARCLRWHV